MDQLLISKDKTISLSDDNVVLENGKELLRTIDNAEETLKGKEEAYKIVRNHYYKKLCQPYENLVVLSGAGTSIDDATLGKTMVELWNIVSENPTINLVELCSTVNHRPDDKDLEGLLSRIMMIMQIHGDSYQDLNSKLKLIEDIIKKECTITLPESAHHGTFLTRLTHRKLKYPRAKIFTLNYDTLFEQAAEQEGIVLVDGFSFSSKRKFRGTNFDLDFVFRANSRIKDEENIAPKVLHLYKLHGSINWEKDNESVFQRENPARPLLIYPKSSKYEHSYEQPFFEMISRFQNELRKENTLLIVVGFSLSDKHISTIIKESIISNTSLDLVFVCRSIRNEGDWKWIKDKASLDSRIMIVKELFKDFAIHYPEVNSITKREHLQSIYEPE